MPQSPADISRTGSTTSNEAAFDPASITRPVPALMTYYIIVSLLTVFGFPFVILPFIFKYNTLRYKFDDKGVSMSYGLLFRKEIYLTYRRIQDIHVTRNFIHRWLGLAVVSVQTASGGGGAEMSIEGIHEPERLRDYLYARMRGARDGDEHHHADPLARGLDGGAGPRAPDEALALLHEIRDEIRALRERSRT